MKFSEMFFATARERYRIYLKRCMGETRPWTTNEVFLDYRFCNVFREDDKTTAWFREHVRDPLSGDPSVLMATVAFRWFNRIETGEALLPVLTSKTGWQSQRARRIVDGLDKAFTAAFIIRSDFGMPKRESICDAIDRIYEDRNRLIKAICYATLEEVHGRLIEYRMMGNFMAYEVVTDLRHTYMLDGASDVNTWCSPGPGCARGASRVVHGEVGHFNYASRKSRAEVLEVCRELLELSRTQWPKEWPRWEMREVEHWLCEFDKFQRVSLGEGRPKQKYKGRA